MSRTLPATKNHADKSVAAALAKPRSKPVVLPMFKSIADDWKPCACLICGRLCMMLTHAHAEQHGYKDKWAMIADNKIKLIKKYIM